MKKPPPPNRPLHVQQAMKRYRQRRRQEDFGTMVGCGAVLTLLLIGAAILGILMWAIIRLVLHFT